SYFVCDDVTCAHRSRRLTFKPINDGTVCSVCHQGTMKREYSAKMLYDQQCFFKSVFDLRTAVEKTKHEEKRKLQTYPNYASLNQMYERLLEVCDQFLAENAYNEINLSHIFAPMKIF
uniref:Zinc finger DNA-directed DNA polymerase family B alpha domain-containing protein n=1 Tax=Plectus sambesii TaxID=2011161 RepID=A0A914VB07_9BILA